jgi:mRNA (guanine-N7-)-methyltransferase
VIYFPIRYLPVSRQLTRHRSLTQEYNLELQFRKPFLEIWEEEKDDPELGPLSERMGVRARGGGPLLVTSEELEAASKFLLWIFESFKS